MGGIQLSWQFCGFHVPFLGDGENLRDPNSKAMLVTSKSGIKCGHELNHLVVFFPHHFFNIKTAQTPHRGFLCAWKHVPWKKMVT